VAQSEEEERDRQRSATVVALAAIGPKDELEGMIAAQLLAKTSAGAGNSGGADPAGTGTVSILHRDQPQRAQ
jgi:hypothetical protein